MSTSGLLYALRDTLRVSASKTSLFLMASATDVTIAGGGGGSGDAMVFHKMEANV